MLKAPLALWLLLLALWLLLPSVAFAQGWPAVNSDVNVGREAIAAAAQVATNVALAASSTAAYPNGVWRNDFAGGNDTGPLFFMPQTGTCVANSMTNDGTYCVNSSDSNSWKSARQFIGNNADTPITTKGWFTKIANNSIDIDYWFPFPQWNVLEVVLDIPPGTTAHNNSAVATYLRNRSAASIAENSGVGVNFMAVSNSLANDSYSFGLNTVNNSEGAGATGRYAAGYEADFNLASPNDRVRGIGLYGLTFVELVSDVRDAVAVGSLSIQQPGVATWLRGFVCEAASIVTSGACLDIQPDRAAVGGIPTTPDRGGPAVKFWYTESDADIKHFSIAASNQQSLVFNADSGVNNGGVEFFPNVLFRNNVQWAFVHTTDEQTYSLAVDDPTNRLVFYGSMADATVQFNTTLIPAGPVIFGIGTLPTSCAGELPGRVYVIEGTGALHVC